MHGREKSNGFGSVGIITKEKKVQSNLVQTINQNAVWYMFGTKRKKVQGIKTRRGIMFGLFLKGNNGSPSNG